MSSRFSHTSNLTKIIIIIEFLLVGYLVYSLTKNVYNSYQIDKYIETYQTENEQVEEENRQKREDYLYFTSEEYIDKIAKQNLGLINSGEEVIVLSSDVLSDDIVLDNSDVTDFARYSGMSNSEQWWDFFFGK
ncbi:MAG: septum formation initiator family protein [Nitrospirota bacterium]